MFCQQFKKIQNKVALSRFGLLSKAHAYVYQSHVVHLSGKHLTVIDTLIQWYSRDSLIISNPYWFDVTNHRHKNNPSRQWFHCWQNSGAAILISHFVRWSSPGLLTLTVEVVQMGGVRCQQWASLGHRRRCIQGVLVTTDLTSFGQDPSTGPRRDNNMEMIFWKIFWSCYFDQFDQIVHQKKMLKLKRFIE